MELDARHLRLIQAVHERGSLAKAALALGISQPAVSRQLMRLESAFGSRLFEREGGGVVPTVTGQLLLRRISSVLPLMDDLVDDLNRLAADAKSAGRIRVGAVLDPVIARLAQLVGRSHPGMAVAVVNDESAERLLALLADHRLELALVKDHPNVPLPVPDETAVAVLVDQPLVALVPREHRLAEAEAIELADLRDEPWVLPPATSSPLHGYVRDVCGRHGFAPDVVHLAETAAAAGMVVRSGAIGIAGPLDRQPDGVVGLPLRGEPLRYRLLMVWNPEATLAATVEPLVTAMTAACAEDVADSPACQRHARLRGDS